MSKISYPQLIKNIADTYRDATGSSEPVVIGELTSKLTEAMNNNNQNSTVQKTISCEAGVEVIQPVYANTEIEINNSNMTVETTVALESEE